MDCICYKKNNKLYFPRDMIPSKRSVLEYLGVREKTYAGDMIGRLYDDYFIGAVDFQKEYDHYYSKEFAKEEDYIEEHYNISPEKAKKYVKLSYCMKDLKKQSIERNVETLMEDNKFRTLFSEAVGGIDDEDPDGFYY